MRRRSSPSKLGFTVHDRKRLERELTETESARLFRRIQLVLLVARGSSFAEASFITGLCLRSAYNLVDRYLQFHSVASLRERKRSGRPPVASEITAERILAELRRPPLSVGYRSNAWSVRLLADRLNERYNCAISPDTLRRRMRSLGLRFKRPRYVYSEKEPHLAQKKGLLSGD
jgi:transposase